MGIIQKQAIQNTFLSYLGALLGFITVGIIFPNLLSTGENGLIKLLVSLSTLFAQISNLGSGGVITRLFPYFRNKEKKHYGFLFYPVIVSLAGFIICTILFFSFRDVIIERNIEKSKLFVDYLYYLIPLTFFTLFYLVFDAFTRSILSSVIGTFLKDFIQRIFILAVVGLYYFSFIDFQQFIALYVASICLPTLLIVIYLVRKKEWGIIPDYSFLTKTMAYEMVNISLFSILTSFSYMIISTIDSIMINDYMGLEATGIYGITFYFGAVIIIPARSIGRISSAVLADSWKNNNLEVINTIYRKSCINQLIIGSVIFSGIWVNIDNLLLMLPPEYAAGKYVIFFVGLSNLIDMATGVNGVIISTSKYYRYDGFFMLFLVIAVIFSNIIFIPLYGIAGAAMASAMALFSFNLLRYIFLYIKFKMQPFNILTIITVLVLLFSFIINTTIPSLANPFIDAFIRSIMILTIFSILVGSIWKKIR